ncbi:MAG: hypothetical protein A3K19_24610 [Lentisphaerae bacterium RIFOXYB12_FULL_65_16]|nr:MAG: hypothetical protein A3K19_24610 [Lentisphaerae bacterium RIFOXYB12_FULL_65_16]
MHSAHKCHLVILLSVVLLSFPAMSSDVEEVASALNHFGGDQTYAEVLVRVKTYREELRQLRWPGTGYLKYPKALAICGELNILWEEMGKCFLPLDQKGNPYGDVNYFCDLYSAIVFVTLPEDASSVSGRAESLLSGATPRDVAMAESVSRLRYEWNDSRRILNKLQLVTLGKTEIVDPTVFSGGRSCSVSRETLAPLLSLLCVGSHTVVPPVSPCAGRGSVYLSFRTSLGERFAVYQLWESSPLLRMECIESATTDLLSGDIVNLEAATLFDGVLRKVGESPQPSPPPPNDKGATPPQPPPPAK